ncbi:MAG: Lrp/AsnC ligand binding domain-containing protein [Candidatus Thorarchaeota archaeon]|jgi:DNA-binding Lrp family transcriptional regulator|nr:Lrp/AsnC ligand binding domain-containing protein [Candidatus Thorarchaeota archaeon]
MVKSYVLIKTQAGKEDKVLRDLGAMNVVEEAHKVFGEFDIVAEVRARDMETVVEVVTERIRKVGAIEDTQTLLVIDLELDMTSTGLAN